MQKLIFIFSCSHKFALISLPDSEVAIVKCIKYVQPNIYIFVLTRLTLAARSQREKRSVRETGDVKGSEQLFNFALYAFHFYRFVRRFSTIFMVAHLSHNDNVCFGSFTLTCNPLTHSRAACLFVCPEQQLHGKPTPRLYTYI